MIEGIAEAKADARKAALIRRAAAHAALTADAGGAFVRQFFQHFHPEPGLIIAAYLPISSEADPGPILDGAAAAGCRTALAAMLPGEDQGEKNRLVFSLWRKGAALSEGPFGTRHPAELVEVRPDIIIAPLLAFDHAGQRLGYGGGHYDRAIARLRAASTVRLHVFGLAFAAQEVDRLPSESTDQPLDGVITENGFRFF